MLDLLSKKNHQTIQVFEDLTSMFFLPVGRQEINFRLAHQSDQEVSRGGGHIIRFEIFQIFAPL